MAHPPYPRRRMLGASVASLVGLALPGAFRTLAAAALPPTPAQTPGPFYPLSYPADSDNDLVHVSGHPEPAKGVVTRISGRILDRDGHPVTGARVEIWQCDANGRYHHVRDDRADRPRDDNFQGYGKTVTDGSGGYRFLTIRPVPYPGRTPHVHFAVSGGGKQPFVTQMYVAGEPGNDRDQLLRSISDPAARDRIIVALQPAPEIGPEALAGTFDIVLGAG
jgi:protocatechuate 3,4-dioxygenase, beta subunit